MVRKASEAREKHKSSKRRSVKTKKLKKKKDTAKRQQDKWVTKRSAARREYDKWFKVLAKLHEAGVERKRQIKTVADFLKQIIPSASSSSTSSPRDASHSGTQTELVPTKRYIKAEHPAIPA
jgi:hypothetical protein